MDPSENPYPAQAVAVYDAGPRETSEFAYMRAALKPLHEYLHGYPNYPCALALVGGHGSGKTHLLSWLARQISLVRHGAAHVAYAKTDEPNPVDLYRQILRNWTRNDLLAIQRRALTALGSEAAGAVKATEAAGRKIHDYDSLSRAFQEKDLDLNVLQIELRKALVSQTNRSAVDTARRVAAAVGLLDDTTYGEAAYSWLCGDPIANMPNEALQTGLFGSTGSANTAVFALETLAVLFRLAEAPMVIIIDQIENFLTADDVAGKSSNLKKLVEQLSSKGVAIVMAGTPGGWENMPRDVGPRLYERKPLTVGSLTPKECSDLLELPLLVRLGAETGLSDDVVTTIHELSGGNPREILRIAHHAFDLTNGALDKFAASTLTKAAVASGTLGDRRALARSLINEVARREGVAVTPAPDNDVVECFARTVGGQALPIVLAVAADSRAEAALARALTSMLKQGDVATEGGPLVIAIGYSSERVRQLLRGVADIVIFDEMTLKGLLKDRFDLLKSAAIQRPPATDDDELSERLQRIDTLLAGVEAARAQADRQIAEMLAARTAAAAGPEREAAEVRTRYELRDGLDELVSGLAERSPEVERRTIRRLLIANETNVQDLAFDFLGSVYLDALDLERIHRAEKPPSPVEWEAHEKAFEELRRVRADIVGAMRRVLTEQRASPTATRSARAILAGVGALIVAVLLYLWMSFGRYQGELDKYRRDISREFDSSSSIHIQPIFFDYLLSLSSGALLLSAIAGAFAGLAIFFVLDMRSRPSVRYASFRLEVVKAQTKLEQRPRITKSMAVPTPDSSLR